MEVAACYRPADELTGLGGDWFDVIPLSGARVALVVGDVVGHGIEAAAAMGRLRAAVQTLADLDLPPEEVLAHLDDLVDRAGYEDDTEAAPRADGVRAKGASCLYAVYDPVGGRCSMAAAGHGLPAIVAPDGTVDFPELPPGPALGVSGPPFESVELPLAEGSVLALCTDGLLAAEGPAPQRDAAADRERLRRVLERPAPSLDDRCQAVVEALVPARPPDDVVLLMARARRLDAERTVSWELSRDPAAVADVRKRTSRQLCEWGLDELTFTTELVVSELVTNAIRHASGPIRLRLIMSRPWSARSGTPAPPPRTCATRRRPTRAAAACSWSPSSPSAGAPATPGTARSSGPSSHSRARRSERGSASERGVPTGAHGATWRRTGLRCTFRDTFPPCPLCLTVY
jgi:hypothetical protein